MSDSDSTPRGTPCDDESLQAELNPREALELAVLLHRQGRLLEAQQIYAKVLEIVPEQPDALHFLEVACCQLGQQQRAVELIGRAIARAPENAGAHTNLGNVLCELGRWDEAADAYRTALEVDPNHAEAHHNLGVLLRRDGRMEEAAGAFRRAVALNPNLEGAQLDLATTLAVLRSQGRLDEAAQVVRRWLDHDPGNPAAQHLLAAYTGDEAPTRASDGYVQRVFDGYAAKYDDQLAALNYRGPELIANAIARHRSTNQELVVLDAGCGTGLSGPPLKPFARRLVGVDLSPGMLANARQRGVYDEFVQAELTEYLAARHDEYDVIASADTLNYFGDLVPVLTAARGALRPGGLLVFTLEARGTGPGAAPFGLNPSGRYSHTHDYVVQAASEAGLTLLSIATEPLRVEFNDKVMGWTVTCTKPNA